MNRLLRLWRRPVVYRSAIGVYVLLVLTLAGVALAIYSIGVDGSMYVRGEAEFEKERDHGIQGRFFHAPSRTSVLPETMEWTLERGEGAERERYPVEFVEGPADEVWPNSRFRISDDVPNGDYELRVYATHERVPEMIATREVTVGRRPAPVESVQELHFGEWAARDDNPDRRRTPVRRVDGDEEAPEVVELVMAPADGELVRGVPGAVLFRTFDPETGAPVPATVELELAEGSAGGDIPSRFQTNELGIATVELSVGGAISAVELEAAVRPRKVDDSGDDGDLGGEEGEEHEDGEGGQPPVVEHFEVALLPVVTRYAIDTSTPVVTPGDEIHAVVYSTLVDREFMADLHDVDGMRFLDGFMVAMSDGEAGLQFTAPDTSEASPLLHLQTYQSLYGTTHGWDDAYVLVVDDDSEPALREAAMELYSWIADETESDHHRWLVEEEAFEDLGRAQLTEMIDAGLHEIPRTFELPEELLNTRAQDRRELEAWRQDAQADLRVMMALTLIVGIVVFVYFVILGIRRNQRENALMRELAIELDEEAPDVEAMEKGAALERLSVVLQGLIVVCTLIVFAIGIFFILSYL